MSRILTAVLQFNQCVTGLAYVFVCALYLHMFILKKGMGAEVKGSHQNVAELHMHRESQKVHNDFKIYI